MIEDSPEQFVREWAAYANRVEIFPHIENTPLFEVRLATGKILHLFDRTGPYTVRSGDDDVLINPMVTEVHPATEPDTVEEHRRGALRAVGTVERIVGRTFGLNAGGVKLAVSMIDGELPNEGERVCVMSLPGVHAFITEKYLPRFGVHRRAE